MSIPSESFKTIVSYVVNNWKRSQLATFTQAVAVPDPGFGQDVVSPIAIVGMPFDANDTNDVAPFTVTQLRDHKVAGSIKKGVGYIALELAPYRDPVVLSPGDPPEMMEEEILRVTIAVPSGRGPRQANDYAGALASILRFKYLEPSETPADFRYIENQDPPPERPEWKVDEGEFDFYLWSVVLQRFYAGVVADGGI